MLKEYSAFFSLVRSIVDLVVIGSCWLIAYFIRFHWGIFDTTKGIPHFKEHLIFMLPIICICYLACWWVGLYKPQRLCSISKQFIEILKTSLLSGLIMLAFFYYVRNIPYSRKLLVIFIVMLFWGLFFSHMFTVVVLRKLRNKGYNLRYYAVIGAGEKGQMLVQDIRSMEWLGLKCKFFIDNDPSFVDTKQLGIPVYGPIEKILELIKVNQIDEVYLAMSGDNAQLAHLILESLQRSGITIRIVPDWGNLISISKPTIVHIGSQVLFSSSDSPLSGYRIFLKRIFDLVVSILMLLVFSIPMLIIALLIKLSSDGPIIYKQTRVGLDQNKFEILKFRTMRTDAEKESEPKWSKPGDERCTPIGKLLRRTSLDELPQLINVVRGEMSLIGPRPERPCFTKQFSEEYRKYMLRHKVKVGLTGWAQVNDLRGNTSLRKRLVYDFYYIRNWSLWLDIWILLRTPWHIVRGKNAH